MDGDDDSRCPSTIPAVTQTPPGEEQDPGLHHFLGQCLFPSLLLLQLLSVLLVPHYLLPLQSHLLSHFH